MSIVSDSIAERWPFKGGHPKRVVIKIGSNVLAMPGGGLNAGRIADICGSIATVVKSHKPLDIIIVSSGAVAAGRGILGLKKRPATIPELQAVAAIGQGALMEAYARKFRTHGLVVGQVLLNREDFEDRRRYLNARHALHTLLGHGAIPIINENDTVNIAELKFGDNDLLSAMVAAKLDADLLLTLSNIPGLMTGHPDEPGSELVPVVDEVGPEIEAYIREERSSLGSGGMRTKLDAARHANRFGITAVIVDGEKPGAIESVIAGRFEGTVFLSNTHRKAGDARKHWIGSTRPKGTIVLDDGAVKALVQKRKSLLPVGISGTNGEYIAGDIVALSNAEGTVVAQGIVNFDSTHVAHIMGRKTTDHPANEQDADYREVVHSNNLVLL